jgi:tetratricopeptide (TPR) repeat protein
MSASSSGAESAYVLAALDLSDPSPGWATILERLRVAASAETGPGRARAALVYALAQSGDPAGARTELDRLDGMTRRHPLMPQLKAFVDRAKATDATPRAPRDAGVDASTVSASELPEKGPGKKPGGMPSDPRVLVAQGEAARARGDYDKAQLLYAAALDKNANDTEALNGLASIAHARNDLNGARASFKRVLSINPSYVPALVGLGDVDWESGDRGAAMKTYKEIVDRFPEGTYPQRVKQRLDAVAPPPAPAPSSTEGGG